MVAKQHPFGRLSMILAASNFSDGEISLMLRHIRSTPLPELLRKIEADRVHIAEPHGSLQVISSPEPQPPDSISMGNEVAEQIERLLVQEAGLTKINAAQALENALIRKHPTEKRYPFNSKDGFARWLRQLSSDFSLSEILHAAATIRNSRVHGAGDDWLDKS